MKTTIILENDDGRFEVSIPAGIELTFENFMEQLVIPLALSATYSVQVVQEYLMAKGE